MKLETSVVVLFHAMFFSSIVCACWEFRVLLGTIGESTGPSKEGRSRRVGNWNSPHTWLALVDAGCSRVDPGV